VFKRFIPRFRTPLIAGSLSLFLSLSAVVAWSIWSNSGYTPPLFAATGVVNGDFHGADSLWQRSTPGFTELHQSDPTPYAQPCGPIAGLSSSGQCPTPVNPNAITTMPGDSFEFTMPLSATVAGNNVAAGFTVGLTNPQPAAATWDATNQRWNDDGVLALEFYVAEPSLDGATLTQVAPGPGQPLAVAGQVLSLADLIPGTGEVTDSYVIVARVTVLGSYAWATDMATANSAPSGTWTAGNLTFEVIQVRGGDN